ncbi:hypothetical protein BpHYR1_004688 [Brachionus plicatilis]|uniref:Uncharacterized protein n=1 Tax=Brachionus plicatilis TaxID=10195 RepID=A0A3M7R398_BRAPC|nr:hypothetical protein BpHYR1_004688 [Brachionus plicatilis]
MLNQAGFTDRNCVVFKIRNSRLKTTRLFFILISFLSNSIGFKRRQKPFGQTQGFDFLNNLRKSFSLNNDYEYILSSSFIDPLFLVHE